MKLASGQLSIGSIMILIAFGAYCCAMPDLTLFVLIPIALIWVFLIGIVCGIVVLFAVIKRVRRWMDRWFRSSSESRIARETKPIEHLL